ncbi:uncharacterized protein BXZ73DRAFT_111316 [Epithele typhae]|uniref:uncharacterized protein n=1 Tax=Epithele typhae TaxID=378194 RepID=UPI002008936B|nr:uncharacterized protein BXZ73DRAFT_111316 [Epithele typhae]KAH9904232.1 hypothetical protein BXZ73DRAFT_111316 [Epithele typhae]
MLKTIYFYDIPGISKALAWSPNTWKTRFCLNAKGLPYKTIWVDFPDIEAVCTKIGAAPTAKKRDGSPVYTLPVIYDPNTNTTVSESLAIARYLERRYPDRVVLIPPALDGLMADFQKAVWATFGLPMMKLIIPAEHTTIRPVARPYFRATREARYGQALEEFPPPGSALRAECWATTEAAAGVLAGWWDQEANTKGLVPHPAVGAGERTLLISDALPVSYADAIMVGWLYWFRECLGEESEEWKKMTTWHGGRWVRLMAVMEKYAAVDSGEELQLAKL